MVAIHKDDNVLRQYRVAASCFEPDVALSVAQRRDQLRVHLDALLREQRPDLLVVPEVALVPDFDRLPDCGAEAIDGPSIAVVARLAEEYAVNICMPIIEEAGGRKHNAAIYIDRRGQVAGRYCKHTPTQIELRLGVVPGPRDPNPILLDGLRIGTAICFDENYPDLIWNYIDKGVDLLVFPSYTFGGRLISAWALNCGVPLVCAFPWKSVIYDRDGSILADGGTWTTTVRFGNHPAWIAHTLNMQSRIYHLDYNQAKIAEMMDRYGSGLDIRLAVEEARMQVTATSGELSIERVEREMELIPLQSYLADTRKQADQLRHGSKQALSREDSDGQA